MANRSSLRDMSPADRAALADRIRVVAAAIGTQAEAAEVAGLSLRQIQAILSGESAPSLVAVGSMGLKAGISLEWILTGKGERAASRIQQEAAAAIEGYRPTLDLFRRLERALRRLYQEAGRGMTDEEEDNVIGGAVDLVVGSGIPADFWPQVEEILLASHRAALAHAARKTRRG